MGEGAYPDGVEDFKDLVTGNYYFVDKTMLIADVCNTKDKVLLAHHRIVVG